MKFKSISIKNYRNFENINIKLDNKNVIFGMNDVGKTNFLYALRYMFDRNVRRINFVDTDYYKNKTENPIEIIVSIDIGEENNTDNEKLRSKVKGALLSDQNTVYIKLVAEYDQKEMIGNIILYWGGDLDNLQEVGYKGTLSALDSVFNVIYIDAYVDLYALFKKNIKTLIDNDDDADKDSLAQIKLKFDELNKSISELSGVKRFEEKITPEYNEFRNDDIEITIKSEIAVNGLYSNISPYIKRKDCDELYPTAGEGRKKLLVYAIYNLIAQEMNERKINIFLIEEPENHLHRAMQLALSHNVFVESKYRYVFMSTHSSDVLAEMNNVNLVRLYNENKVDSASSFYTVPIEYEMQKRRLSVTLSEAIFADKVLLVEGPSEELLFDRVLSYKKPLYQVDGIYILSINGIGFEPYIKILRELKIPCVVKTDNDLRKANGYTDYSVIGFRRVNSIVGANLLPTDRVPENSKEMKSKLYNDNKTVLDSIRANQHVYLSVVSLEEDLDEAIHAEMVSYLPNANGDVISYLKEQKKYNMVELVEKLKDEDCEKIYGHYNFACLEDVLS